MGRSTRSVCNHGSHRKGIFQTAKNAPQRQMRCQQIKGEDLGVCWSLGPGQGQVLGHAGG